MSWVMASGPLWSPGSIWPSDGRDRLVHAEAGPHLGRYLVGDRHGRIAVDVQRVDRLAVPIAEQLQVHRLAVVIGEHRGQDRDGGWSGGAARLR